MTLGERIKKVRKALDLTQQKFAKQIGTTQNNIASYEIGRREPSAAAINNICKTFHVNEEWLRSGTGDMLVQPDTLSLDQYAKDRGCTELEFEILKAYFDLDPDIRETVVNHFRDRLSSAPQPPPPSPALADLAARVDALEKEESEIEARQAQSAKTTSRSH